MTSDRSEAEPGDTYIHPVTGEKLEWVKLPDGTLADYKTEYVTPDGEVNFSGITVRSGLGPTNTGPDGDGDGGGNPDTDALDEALSHVGGYDSADNAAEDPVSSQSKGHDPEEWYAEEASDRQQERLSGEDGPFTESGEVESDNVAGPTDDGTAPGSSGGGSNPPAPTTTTSDSADSGGSDSTPVPDEVADALPDSVSPGMAAVAVAAAVYFGVIR